MLIFPSTREYAQQYGLDKTLLESLSKENSNHAPWP
jgi:hypothetical protein